MRRVGDDEIARYDTAGRCRARDVAAFVHGHCYRCARAQRGLPVASYRFKSYPVQDTCLIGKMPTCRVVR